MVSLCSIIFRTLFTLFIYEHYSSASRESDRIKYLPAIWPQPEFAQFSGYVDGVNDNFQIHYWLVRAENAWATAPLILWLNGGPGCSSLFGLLSENGPFTIVNGSQLIYNPYSWNKIANLLYFESPVGVGFSYAKDGNITTDDDLTAQNNFHALKNFLNKFPEFKKRDFYITGESYGGVYVPTLALLVIDSLDVNFKGIAVGNALTNYLLNDNSLLYYLNWHGIIDESMWNDLLTNCCGTKIRNRCMFTQSSTRVCQYYVNYIFKVLLSGVDPYNFYSECVNDEDSLRSTHNLLNSTTSPYVHSDFGNLFRNNSYVKIQRHLLSKLREQHNVRLKVSCTDPLSLRNYLNLDIVQKFMHVNRDLPDEWDDCSDKVNNNYIRTYNDLSNQYKKLLQSKISVLLYNGDVDMVCNALGDEWFVDDLNLEIESEKSTWFYREKDGSLQVGGFRKIYKHKDTELIFTTIRGAGHMVPEDKPLAALHMIQRFINSQPF